MKRTGSVCGALFALAVSAATVFASDPVAVYTRVDRVVLEPNAEAPQTIQIWGVFAMAKPEDRNDYLPPSRGYLYFVLPSDARAADPDRYSLNFGLSRVRGRADYAPVRALAAFKD